MSRPQPPKPAKLLIGLIMQEKRYIAAAADALIEKFGPVDMASSWLPFDYTTYYEPEMGAPLFRRILAFKTLIKQSELAQIKLVFHWPASMRVADQSPQGKRLNRYKPVLLSPVLGWNN